MLTSSLFQKAYELTQNSNTWNKSLYKKITTELLEYNRAIKGNLLTPLNECLTTLNSIDYALIPYLSAAQGQKLLRELQVTYLFLLAEKEYELTHQKTENSADYDRYLRQCQMLIDAIRYKKFCGLRPIQPAAIQSYGSEEKPVAYLGLFAGKAFAQQMVDLSSGSVTKGIKSKMGSFNEKRLYWVWASSFVKTMLALFPDDFFSVNQAKATMSLPDPYTGTLSWGLYYFRFALNLGLLLKHTIKGPWMSKIEQEEPWTERFTAQWQQRKFSLLNDFFWATGNALCFFILYGKGAAGTAGDALTLALLVFDISLAVWDYEEQRTQHARQINDYYAGQLDLKRKMIALKAIDEQARTAQEKARLIDLEIQYATLLRAERQCAREWNYQRIHCAVNISYAVGLMVSFTILAAPYLPLAATTLASMTVCGAVLCFALSLLYNGVKGGIELKKIKMTIAELKTEQKEKIAAFKELAVIPGAHEDAKKLLFLELKQARLEEEYQQRVLTLRTMQLIRSIIIEAVVPALVFVSLVFLPLGPGIGILAVAIALALLTHLLVNTLFKAEKGELKELDEAEYQQFCANPDDFDAAAKPSLSFFKPRDETLEKELPTPAARAGEQSHHRGKSRHHEDSRHPERSEGSPESSSAPYLGDTSPQ